MEITKTDHIFLSDYKPSDYKIDDVFLTFKLHPSKTIVISKMTIVPIKKSNLFLNGIKLKLKDVKINGSSSISLTKVHDEGISFEASDLPDKAFSIEITTEINPQANTSLEGLYLSNGMYCTQCEAEGFRKITYYLDRPDIMAKFKVRVESKHPTKLSNGNQIDEGEGWAEWDDPWPKPSYLFALVAGDLLSFDDYFVTRSGKEVVLKIWVRKEDINKCAFAMDALKRSMLWDEVNYGREYDLSIFQIVAVDDFNMGAMENKGLNIFNSKYVLASPETATDNDYKLIEGIIAHEYFHNWTGNRITCRDWFQLSLKEGLTVFRDQQFSADQRGSSIKRINDVIQLRNRQFEEDNGPLSHPVRPSEYKEINNFYKSYFFNRKNKIPFVTGKIAVSKNNLIYSKGTKRITNIHSDKLTHFLRYKNDSLMISYKTLNEDNPKLNCRLEGLFKFSPKRIILDSNLKMNTNSYIFKTANKNNTTIFYKEADGTKISKFKKKGIQLIKSSLLKNGNFDIKVIFKKLYSLGCRNLLVEGGNDLSKSIINKKLFNQFYLFKGSKNLSKSIAYKYFNFFKDLSQKYKSKNKIKTQLGKDLITLYKK